MRKEKERGAIVAEATISLTAFVFAIFTILSLVNIYYIQAKIGVSLNSAAKEISQYSYLYYALGINRYDAEISAGTEDERKLVKDTIDGVGTLLNSFSEIETSVETVDFDNLAGVVTTGEKVAGEVETMTKTVDSLVTEYAEKIGDNPKEFILGMGKMALSELKEEGKAILGQVLAKALMKKNLRAYPGDDADAFLKRHHVVGGMSGLNFRYTSLMAYGTSNLIQLCVTYDVRVIRLLNVDVKFTFRQVAKTNAWGNGVSQIQPQINSVEVSEESPKASVWDNPSTTERGKIIVLEEQKKYTYISSGKQGFDIYNNAGGANQFITVTSVDTSLDSYQEEKDIRYRMNADYRKMMTAVTAMGPTINMQNRSGASVPITSNADTRTYKLILVVPANSDMEIVNEAVRKFKNGYPGAEVEVNTGYGSPSPKTETNPSDNNTEEPAGEN